MVTTSNKSYFKKPLLKNHTKQQQNNPFCEADDQAEQYKRPLIYS